MTNRTMIEHILTIKPTIDNNTPQSFVQKRIQGKSHGVSGSLNLNPN